MLLHTHRTSRLREVAAVLGWRPQVGLALGCLVCVLGASPGRTQTETSDEVLKQLDAYRYEPQRLKLTDASARVEVPSVAARLAEAKCKAQIQYVWQAPGRYRLQLTGLPKTKKGLALEAELLGLLERQGHYLIQPSVAAFARDFNLSTGREGALFRITGTAFDPSTELRTCVLWMAANGRVIRRLYETETMRELDSALTYRAVEGGALLTGYYATTVVVPKQPEPDPKAAKPQLLPLPALPKSFWDESAVVRRVSIEYGRVGEFSLPVALTSSPVRGDSSPFSLRLTDYKTNTGVEDAFFKGTGVGKAWR
ncbi:MAG: hypothetical protein COZ06_21755 [Armatimonadetes bacterium CG_4_10_14_3_um_filter_66_18]|nr:hypothetical protein [Armatimonadota bacterium]OIP01721.1 MAG: hypothetical protein AUJ96_17185 [Armatimonadetes bacterium CG2_30_66_41]PIU88002.1 MAG: hypothetical protein COS65_31760 [Armatimonadetes bacterium CG06_land_8_20_14_3_00_66_21]PIX40501.1 MAG: hypothetical protein COZ57_25785 [Armatimonadetes bacterium CG_4_8_14_3_um_filter_66_20]PIY43924.1 MAG: hypothetical protein COZ06_21755 [Armatimonadetes bacterium CG_4_10_14_3_um_filter_66_18]PIZ34765.1 MAG: hypothetical protein COY42_28